MMDKPPLALWIQTLFTKALGYEGWVMVLPMALAGTVAVPFFTWLPGPPLACA